MLRLGLLVTLCAVLHLAALATTPTMVTINGHNMVKLRAFCHRFGAVTTYDATLHTYSVSRNERTLYLTPYSATAWIDDRQVELKAPPVVVDHALYVPLHFMCRTFDLDCTWGTGYQQAVVIDNTTHLQITWVLDSGWDARPHIWKHPITFRIIQKPQFSPRQSFHGKPLVTRHAPTPVTGHLSPAIDHVAPGHGHMAPGNDHMPPAADHTAPGNTHIAPGSGLAPPAANHAPPAISHTPPPSGHPSHDNAKTPRNDNQPNNDNKGDKHHGR